MSLWRPAWTIFRLVNLRHLRRRWRRALLTLFAIAASVALVVAMSVVDATLRQAIDTTAVGVGGSATLAVTPRGAVPLSRTEVESVRRVPGVRAAVPISHQIARIEHAGVGERALVFGIPHSAAGLLAALSPGAGEIPPWESRGILLSRTLAGSLTVGRGDSAVVETPRGPSRVAVTGLLDGSQLSSVNGGQLGVLPFRLAGRLFARVGAVDVIYVFAEPGASAASLRRAIEAKAGAIAFVARPGAEAEPYRHTFEGIASLAQLIQLLALAVTVVLVLNTVAMSVVERQAELSLVGMVGARSRHAVVAFIVEAGLVGLLGGILGTAAGFLLATIGIEHAQSAYQSVLPTTSSGSVSFSLSPVLLGLGCGIAVSVVGTGLAARRIAGAEPIALLRPALPDALAGASGIGSRWLAGAGAAAVACALALMLAPPHPRLGGLMMLLTFSAVVLLLPSFVAAVTAVLGRRGSGRAGLVRRLVADGLLHAPGRTVVTVGALAVSAAMVVATTASLGSIEGEAQRIILSWYVPRLYVQAPGSWLLTSDQPLPVDLGRRLAAMPGVREAYPMRFALLNRGGRQMAVFALPVAEAADHGDTITRDIEPQDHTLVAALRRGEVMISRYMARQHGVTPGDAIALPTAEGPRRFRVAGTINDLNAADSVYLEHRVYERVTGDAKVDRFAIESSPGVRIPALRRRLRQLLGEGRVSASVVTRRQVTGSLLDAMHRFFLLADGVQFAALLIAAMIIASTMLTVTFERRRQFGLQRTIGMSRLQLGASLVLEAAVLAAMGVALAIGLGLALGWVMTSTIADQLAWEVAFRPAAATLVLVAVASLAVAIVAAVLPGWLATRFPLISLVREE